MIGGALRTAERDREIMETTVAVLRRSAAVVPAFNVSLANALRKLARSLAEEGQPTAALAIVEDAIRICRRGMASRRSGYSIELTWSLCKRADLLERLERLPEAESAAREALALCRSELPRNPRRFGPALLVVLDTLARALDALEQSQEALSLGEELVEILQRLAPRRPEYERALALALHLLGVYALHAERYADALRATDEAIQVYQRLEDQQPGSFTKDREAATYNRDLFLDVLTTHGKVVLGPYPLCARCEQVNGGLVATRHRQRHVRVGGNEACVDSAIADVIVTLWERGCTTFCSCEDLDGRAGVVPGPGDLSLAVEILQSIGIHAEAIEGALLFPLRARARS